MRSEAKGSVLMQRYELGRLLGHGTFAKVYHGRNIRTSQGVAVKIIDKEKVFKVGLIDQIKREVSIMRLVRHPNIVQLYEVMATKSKIYFVLEYVKGGELFNKVLKGRIKEDFARKYFQQLVSAVDFCHSRGVYHRDLKPENLLLDDNGNLKVSDFGLSALAESKKQDGLLHTTCGTPAYVAPEVINRRGYDGAKADIWSCGVILFVLLAGYLPFQEPNLMEMYKKIEKAEFKFPTWFPSDVRKLITRILDPNPTTRISIRKITENSWFRKGFNSYETKHKLDVKELISRDVGAAFASPAEEGGEEEKEVVVKPLNLNAFDLISLSSGFDLSGMFEEAECKPKTRFTSSKPASVIVSKIEEVARRLRLRVKRKGEGVLSMEGVKEGRKGVMEVDAEIFEVTPAFHMVEISKRNGDTLEYQKMWKEDMRPGLKDIVWAWQGEPPLAPPQQIEPIGRT
ncbi:CBL-interacting protein kinase 18 [Platanthera zijinensis]|uniref:non-specific serine/threonine protein kinase n=1 Tax=Platanthera zijinensis TaxID=2320716 RepID=A0AAP0B5F4_9ASPA